MLICEQLLSSKSVINCPMRFPSGRVYSITSIESTARVSAFQGHGNHLLDDLCCTPAFRCVVLREHAIVRLEFALA